MAFEPHKGQGPDGQRKIRALLIQDERNKFKDLGDVLQVARALGQQVFKTHENVQVRRIWYDFEYGYVCIVEGPSRSKPPEVRGWNAR